MFRLKSAALRLYGNWLIETYSANPQVIITDYLLQSISLVQTEGHSYSAGTYDELASYADQQYQRVFIISLMFFDLFIVYILISIDF